MSIFFRHFKDLTCLFSKYFQKGKRRCPPSSRTYILCGKIHGEEVCFQKFYIHISVFCHLQPSDSEAFFNYPTSFCPVLHLGFLSLLRPPRARACVADCIITRTSRREVLFKVILHAAFYLIPVGDGVIVLFF